MSQCRPMALVIIVFYLVCHIEIVTAMGQLQATTADLSGTVKDVNGKPLAGVNITIRNQQKSLDRSVVSDEFGNYRFLSVIPGTYTLTAETPSFSPYTNENVVLTIGQMAVLNFILRVPNTSEGSSEEGTYAESEVEVIETSKTAITQTIDSLRIDNLPINGRNFLFFSLTNSQLTRDNSPLIGSAPNTGLNFGGQVARANLIQIDGADNIDNTINAARSTLSQEAIQEFQVIINSFSAQFGRTSGGVVNIVTKSGTNEFHGKAFGFIRQRAIQARNALAFQPDGSDEKPAFTRGQYGFTFGGPIQKDRMYFFLSLEQTRRQESGFSTIGLNSTIFDLTPAQQAYIAANGSTLVGQIYSRLATSGAGVARTGVDPITGQPIFFSSLSAFNLTVPIPASFRTLTNIQNVYPISEKFSFYSIRLDRQLTQNNNLTVRYNFTPATTTGIQSSSQNQQIFGLNDVSRTGRSVIRDTSVVVQDIQALSANKINEVVFNFARRGTAFVSSSDVAINIAGTAFFGSDPLSPVDRVEKRYQIKDNFTISLNSHTFEIGADINIVKLDPVQAEPFFSGRFDFGELDLSLVNPLFNGTPPLTPVQAYGLGLPQVFLQAFGRSNSKVTNKTFGFYGQDSWKITPKITLNYGVRYDVELTPTYAPVGINTGLLSLTAEQIAKVETALGIVQGIPRDKNNVAPRIGVAWSPDNKTVVRAAYGLFYDHPPLFFAFLSDVLDGVQSPQFISIGGIPLPNAPINATQIFQGTIVPGRTPGVDSKAAYLQGQARFDPRAAFPGYGSILPTLLPLSRDFVYGYTNQVNLSVERLFINNVSVNISYLFIGGRKLPLNRDINAPNSSLVLANGGFNATSFANNFFRPSGPNPLFIPSSMPIPFGTINVQEASGSSNYHALSVNLTKRFSNNLQALISYTLSKAIDYSSEFISPQDNNALGAERSLSSLDQRHRFVISAVYKSTFNGSSGGIKKLLSGFVISPIVELSSGRPFNILTGVDTNLDFSASDRPAFDAAANRLTLPALGSTGSLGRNAGISEGFATFDLRLSRTLQINERFSLSFIGEGFNLFNRFNTSAVNSNFRFVKFNGESFRSAPTSVFDPRQFQFAIKLDF